MISLFRAISTERKHLLKLSPSSIIQQQHVSFSTPTRTLPTTKSSKTRPLPEVRSRLPAPPSSPTTTSSVNSHLPKKLVTWPKPSEIPWQAKVVNSVNLIGQVKIPVQFEASSDGKNWAGTIISQDDDASESSSTSLPSFWIPVIFEDDLAHIAMTHLKEKDYVHVAGHLSVDVPPFKLSEVQANVQVMVHSINFVQNSRAKKISTPGKVDRWTTKNSANVEHSVSPQKPLKEFDTIQLDSPSEKSTMDVAFKQEKYVQLPNVSESSPIYKLKGVGCIHSDQKPDKRSVLASWRDFLTNSDHWVDNREKKQKGLVKPRYPDFKHKDTGVGLWLDGAPVEILQSLRQLEYSDLPTKDAVSVRATKVEKGDGDPWKNLVENPNKWWDNRLDKRNQKAPDFKHKDSGEALWLGNAPAWALSSLQPVKAKTADVNTKKAWAGSNWSRNTVDFRFFEIMVSDTTKLAHILYVQSMKSSKIFLVNQPQLSTLD